MKTFIKKVLKKELILLFTCFLFAQYSFAQELNIKGKIISVEDGSSIPLASVLIKGTNLGTVTNLDGTFSITIPANATLVFSYVGYKTVEKLISNNEFITISLQSDLSNLDEVIVIGYQTVKRRDLTGANP